MFSFLMLFFFSARTACPYYPSVNKAEVYITAGDYNAASQEYSMAFARQPHALGQDLYNAALCAIHTGDQARAFDLCRQLAAKGVPLSFFSQKTSFASLRKSSEWPAFIERVTALNHTFRTNNRETLEWMDYLVARGRTGRIAATALSHSDPDWEDASWLYDSLSQVLLTHMQTEGYPSEEQIGLNIINDTILDAAPRFMQIVSRRSYIVNQDHNPLFRQLFLDSGVQRGLLKPEFYLELMASDPKWEEEFILRYYSLYGRDLYKTKSIAATAIDRQRETLGICPLNEELKKLRYHYKNPGHDFSFNLFASQQKWDGETSKDKKKYLDHHELAVRNITTQGN